jgi:formylglycine-generating enzyme required for sulfatase activity
MENHTEFKGLPAEFTMIAIEGNMNGEPFNMGGESWTNDSKSVHKVRLNNFLIGEYPVTQDLWAYVMHSNPSFFKGLSRPIEEVSWFDAVVFCNALNTRCGYEPCYFSDASYEHLLDWLMKVMCFLNEIPRAIACLQKQNGNMQREVLEKLPF